MLVASIFFASVVAVDLEAPIPEIVGDVSVGEGSEEFSFRLTSTTLMNFLPGFNTLYFSSTEVGVGDTISASGIVGSFYVSTSTLPSLSTPPVCYVSQFSSSSSWTGGSDPISGDVSAAAAFIATEYESIEGFDVDGASVGIYYLEDLSWSTATQMVQTNGDLSWVTFVGAGVNGFTVSIDVLTSSVLGDLNWGATVSDRMIKTRVNITNFPGNDDSLVLTMSTLTSMMDGTATITTSVTESDLNEQLIRPSHSGNPDEGVYFDFATQASVDGNMASVDITITDADSNDLMTAQLVAQASEQASAGNIVNYQSIQVQIPSGNANVVLWDPSVATGMPPGYQGSSTLVTVLMAFGIVAGIAVVGFSSYYCFRRYSAKNGGLTEEAAVIPKYSGLENEEA
jgi:hypothetical protein